MLSIPAYFEGITIYFKPFNYPQLFEKDHIPTRQDPVLTFPRLLPKSLMEQETKDVTKPLVQQIGSWSGVYDQNELLLYFDILEKNFLKQDVSEPVSFFLNETTHGILISWEPKSKSWQLVDANHLNLSSEMMTTDQLTKQVMAGFSKNGITTFSTEAYTIDA